MPNNDTVPVQAIETTFSIVEALRKLNGAGPSEVAEQLGMATSTVHDHLRTLEESEYVIFEDGTYRIGPRIFEFGGHARKQMKIHRVAEPEIQRLALETGEHANLMIEDHGKGIFLTKAQGEDAVHLDTYVGMRVHLQTTALGKAILAHMPRDRVEAILDRHGLPSVSENTITDRETLLEELETSRERGYTIDDEERVTGMRCVAAPIKGEETVLGAVSISSPTSRMKGKRFTEEIPELVRDTANVIEVNMTYR